MRQFVTYSLVIVAALSAAGCSTRPPAATAPVDRSIVHIPTAGTIVTAEVGQSIISKAFVSKTPGLLLPATVSEVVNSPGTTTIQAGKIPLSTTDELGSYYKDPRATYTMLGATVPIGDRAGIFVPNDKSKSIVIFHYTSSYKYGKTPIHGVQPITIETASEGSFKQELVYLGVQQNTITILYREYENDFARPAFSQEIKYDLSQGREIGYKGARFEVLKASNIELSYKMLRPME